MSHAGLAPQLDRTIEPSPRAPAQARRAVGELAPDFDLADSQHVALLRDTQLLVSELVTNSVRHSGSDSPIRVRAWVRKAGLRVEITDGGFGFEPEGQPAGADSESGRGLLILEALTDRWGISRDGHTRVWFEIACCAVSGRHAQTA